MKQSRLFKMLSFAIIATCFLLPVAAFAEEVPMLLINIDVAPDVINIASEGKVVTVHTDIFCSDVQNASVLINGLALGEFGSKCDSLGYYVAKILMTSFEALGGDLNIGEVGCDPGYNTLTLSGVTKQGVAFMGSQQIKVIEFVPKGKQ